MGDHEIQVRRGGQCMQGETGRYRLGCDIGGTFTDFYLMNLDTGETWQEKQLTTPDNPVEGVMLGLKKLEGKAGHFTLLLVNFIHGTTLVINAIIERKGAKTGLITTEGFRDILEIRREERYGHYDLSPKMPKVLVPRFLRRGVQERIDAKGRVLREINEKQLTSVLEDMIDQGVESLAVCLLHSYINPHNERTIDQAIKQRYPKLHVSLSSEVVPKIKEYERTTTTVVNAYTKPKVNQYLAELKEKTCDLGYHGEIYLMMSAGGILSLENAKSFPVRIIESGPVGGVIASQLYGEIKGIPDLISFDMGGTTAKLCLIKDFKAGKIDQIEIDRVDRFKRGSGIPLEVPFVDLAEIGAGGGSIAFINGFGLLQVGPESAGAKPGPACYGFGGDKATVTDSDLVLGYLNANYFLGGEMAIYPKSAERSIQENIADHLGMSLVQAAYGIHDVVCENMANAARIHAIERGYDPSNFALVAYGGAGPVHAYGVARKLKSPRILIPNSAGVEAAFGFLNAPFSFDLSQTYKKRLKEASFVEIESFFKGLEERTQHFLPTNSQGNIQFKRAMDMCYKGQGYEINVPIPREWKLKGENLLYLFNQEYRTLYSQIYEEVEVEIINLKVEAIMAVEKVKLSKKEYHNSSIQEASKGKRKAFCIDRGQMVDFCVYDRYRLGSGIHVRGPAIIEERESTTVIGSNGSASIDEYGVIIIELS